jgi:HAE1 family hydrophobic/amphiphilic exporter-1
VIHLSIRRPVAVAMAYLALTLLGFAAWSHIPIELLPGTELPRLTVQAQWPGASPEATEAFLTAPLEAAIQQVQGIQQVSSESNEQYGAGISKVEARFARGTDMDFARLDLSERLAALEDELPATAYRPQVLDYVPEEFRDQASPFLTYTLTGPYTLEALRRYVDDQVTPALAQVDGVATISPDGGRARLLEIELSEGRIQALGLTPERVRQAVMGLEIIQEAGQLSRGGMQRTLAIRESAESAAEIRRVPVLSDHGRVVRLGDVATVHDTYEEARSHYRIDAQPAVSFTVQKELGTNAVAVADLVKARLAEMETSRPAGVRLILDSDESKSIRAQLSDLRSRALLSALIVFAVLLLFLRSWRSAGLAFASMAAAVLITLNLIYFAGLTLNVLTLMGLAMGFGMIIDNAIVVLDNVFRHRARGRPAREAAERGAREMVLPVLASTLTNLVVLIPFVYLQGELRVYYVPLAIVVALTNLASLFASFSLIPALAGRTLRRAVRPEMVTGGTARPPIYVRVYSALTGWTLRFPWVTMALAIAVFGGSFYLFNKYVTRGAVWGGGRGNDSYISIQISLPRGEELSRTDELARHFEERLREMPEVGRFVTRVQPQYAALRVTFPDSLSTTWVPVAIKEQLEAYSHEFGGAEVRVYGYGPSFYGGGVSPPNYSIQVLGYNYDKVREIAGGLAERLLRLSRIQNVDPNATGRWYEQDRASELVLRLDRGRLGMHGLTARDVVQRVGAAVAGGEGRGSVIRLGGEEVRFAVKLEGHERLDVLALRNLLLPAAGGQGVRLGDIATVDEREVQSRIVRENQQYQRTVAYEFRGPTKLGDRVRDAVVAATRLPPGYSLKTTDDWNWSIDERDQIYGVLAVSLLLVFMVTAALFESIRQPLVVLFSVPMALVGVFLLFFYTGATFTREAYIGVIMMGGVVVNNAILLVDHINVLRRSGTLSFHEAILKGTLERVRPILMTSVTTVLALLPLVLFSESADANIWNALGYALIGGLSSSTLLILTVTPALYLLFERRREKLNSVTPVHP